MADTLTRGAEAPSGDRQDAPRGTNRRGFLKWVGLGGLGLAGGALGLRELLKDEGPAGGSRDPSLGGGQPERGLTPEDLALRDEVNKRLDTDIFANMIKETVPGADPKQGAKFVDGRWTAKWAAGGVSLDLAVEPRFTYAEGADPVDLLASYRSKPGMVEAQGNKFIDRVVLVDTSDGTFRSFTKQDETYIGGVVVTTLYRNKDVPYAAPGSPGYNDNSDYYNALHRYPSDVFITGATAEIQSKGLAAK